MQPDGVPEAGPGAPAPVPVIMLVFMIVIMAVIVIVPVPGQMPLIPHIFQDDRERPSQHINTSQPDATANCSQLGIRRPARTGGRRVLREMPSARIIKTIRPNDRWYHHPDLR